MCLFFSSQDRSTSFNGKILSEDPRFKPLSKEPLFNEEIKNLCGKGEFPFPDPTHYMSFEHIDPSLTRFSEGRMEIVRKLYFKLAYEPKMAGIFPPHETVPGPYYGFREVRFFAIRFVAFCQRETRLVVCWCDVA